MSEPATYEQGLTQQALRPGGSDQPQKLSPKEWASYWSDQIVIAAREHQQYLAEADEVVTTYRLARTKKGASRRRMNVLYGNTETLREAVFARPGKPDVRPRWPSAEAMGQEDTSEDDAQLIERFLTITTDDESYARTLRAAVVHGILCNRGVVWCEHDFEVGEIEAPDGLGGFIQTPSITTQRIRKVLVGRHDFLHSPAETWDEVWWIARRHRMTREDLKANGFKRHAEVPLNWSPKQDGKSDTIEDDDVRRAEVWEVWSKVHRRRFYVCKGFNTILREDEDPYRLAEFWPCPSPLTLASPPVDSVVPTLEWHQYQALADDLEEITTRIAMLTSAMRRRGVRDAAIEELKQLAKAQDNQFVPVAKYQELAQKGGLKAAYEVEDLTGFVQALSELYRAKEVTEASIDKLSGIADVMRGNVDAEEKLGQTQLKAQFGGLRIKGRQREVQRFVRDLMRIEAELVLEFFEPDILSQMTGMDVTPERLERLRDDRLRAYMVDIETDSTVFEDAEAEKAGISEAVQAATALMQQAVPLLQAEPEMGEVVFEMLGAVLRTIKGGRTIEQAIDRARQARQARIEQQMRQPPPPDPRMETEQLKAQTAQAESESKQRLISMDMERADRKHRNEMERMDMQRMMPQQTSASEVLQ